MAVRGAGPIRADAAAAAENACPPNTLGVSRTVEIDTTGGPWFGSPRGDKDFLAPGEVVLTFDDGPTPRYSRTILAALAAQCTKATFFMLGEMAAEYPALVKEIATLGHTIGTHTWSHPNLKRLSDEQARAQIESAFTVIEKAAEQPIAPFFRYPYLSETNSSSPICRAATWRSLPSTSIPSTGARAARRASSRG